MGRYLKYLEIVNKIDSALEKIVAGKVDVNKDLPKLKALLEVQEKAMCMSRQIDHIDDAVKSTAKLYAMGDESAQEVVETLMKIVKGAKDQPTTAMMGGSPQGRDFRSGYQNPRSEAAPWHSDTDRFWPQARGTHEMNDAYDMHEEDRRGVKGTGRYGRRYRAEMDRYDEEDRRGVPGSGHPSSELEEEDRRRSARTGRFIRGMAEEDRWYPLPFMPFYGRMGFTGHPGEANGPYNNMTDGVQIPVQNVGRPNQPSNTAPIQGTPAHPNRQAANAAPNT